MLKRFTFVSGFALVFACTMVYLFKTFTGNHYDPMWIGGISASVVYIWGYMMDPSVRAD